MFGVICSRETKQASSSGWKSGPGHSTTDGRVLHRKFVRTLSIRLASWRLQVGQRQRVRFGGGHRAPSDNHIQCHHLLCLPKPLRATTTTSSRSSNSSGVRNSHRRRRLPPPVQRRLELIGAHFGRVCPQGTRPRLRGRHSVAVFASSTSSTVGARDGGSASEVSLAKRRAGAALALRGSAHAES
jgi:hypothetical protein